MGRKRAVKSPEGSPSERKAQSALDDLLPLLPISGRELHTNVAVLEVAEMSQLAELAANPTIRRFLLARLSDTVALVDPGAAKLLEEALLAEGHTPKRLEGKCQ